MVTRVGIIGARGYVGGELLRLLLQHPGPVRFGLLPDGTRRHLDPIMLLHPLDRASKGRFRAERSHCFNPL